MSQLQNLNNKDDFARLLGFNNAKYINYLLYKIGTDHLYTQFEIAKKNGGKRIINAPDPRLKSLQRRLANLLWKCYLESIAFKSKGKGFKIPSISHGFEKDKSIITSVCDYGTQITASVGRGNVQAVQFHPEKSSSVGIEILQAFKEWKP